LGVKINEDTWFSNMDFVALVSGGKDSIYSILEACRLGHHLVACVHLGRPLAVEEESYMYQTAASEALQVLVEECLQVPLILYPRQGRSIHTSLTYSQEDASDEVEDLYHALQLAVERFPTVSAVCSGAILSTYQRVRIEHIVCGRLGLQSLSFLWRIADQKELLLRMIQDDQIHAVLVRVAAPPGLVPHRHLNKTLQELQPLLWKLHQQYQMHVCGEGGEYESLVLDCPLYHKKLVLDDVEIRAAEDGTGELLIRACHAEEKKGGRSFVYTPPNVTPNPTHHPVNSLHRSTAPLQLGFLPHVCISNGGLWHVSEIMSPSPGVLDAALQQVEEFEANQAVFEMLEIFSLLKRVLHKHGCTAQDVVMVHLYLSRMSHFVLINQHYQEFFGTMLPPSRSCVAVGVLPGGRRVSMDCVVQHASGAYLRTDPSRLDDAANLDRAVVAALTNKTSKLRDVLHVQSRSHWAPVCVGPYSQVNTIRSVLHFVAGQIGLVPATMTLVSESWSLQLKQAWKNLARVLDALDATSLDHLISGLVYCSSKAIQLSDPETLIQLESICMEQLQSNGGVLTGTIDSINNNHQEVDSYDGYEDEETMREMTNTSSLIVDDRRGAKFLPLLVVSVPELPVGALAEVEVMALARDYAITIDMENFSFRRYFTPNDCTVAKAYPDFGWETGYSFVPEKSTQSDPRLEVKMICRTADMGAISSAILTASLIDDEVLAINATNLFGQMLEMLNRKSERELSFDVELMMNIRVYYSTKYMDSTMVRSAFSFAMGSLLKNPPAVAFIPVDDIQLLDCTTGGPKAGARSIVAMQANSVDTVKMETSRWLRIGR
jgi:diphthine-ammonia ligase